MNVQVAAEDAAAVAVRVRELLNQAKEAVLQAERQEVRGEECLAQDLICHVLGLLSNCFGTRI